MEINYHILIITAAFIVLDIVTGFIQAVANKNLTSSKMRDGLFHKIAFILVVALAILCEQAQVYMPDLGFTVPLLVPACLYIVLTEIVSIIENIGKCNSELLNSKLLGLFSIAEKKRRISDVEEGGEHGNA